MKLPDPPIPIEAIDLDTSAAGKGTDGTKAWNIEFTFNTDDTPTLFYALTTQKAVSIRYYGGLIEGYVTQVGTAAGIQRRAVISES